MTPMCNVALHDWLHVGFGHVLLCCMHGSVLLFYLEPDYSKKHYGCCSTLGQAGAYCSIRCKLVINQELESISM